MRYTFSGYGGAPSICDLKVGIDGADRLNVLFTEIVDNPGTSVTNAIEPLVAQVRAEYPTLLGARDVGEVIWLERSSYGGIDAVDLVTFDKGHVVWKRLPQMPNIVWHEEILL